MMKTTAYIDFIEVPLDEHNILRFSPGDSQIVPGIYIQHDNGKYARINIYALDDGHIAAQIETKKRSYQVILI